MNLLLDSHTLIWAAEDPARLGKDASTQLADRGNARYVSAAIIWEIAIKVGLRKLSLSLPYRTWMENAINFVQAQILPIELRERIVSLPPHHGDPFDRLLVAQALSDDLTIVSVDAVLDSYGIRRIW